MPPIFVITGPPAAGKSTVSKVLLQHFELGMHIPVDDVREWVVSGISHPIGWTDETTRQFRLAERGACEVAKTYQDAGFAVAIDHCSGPDALNEMIAKWLPNRLVHGVLLKPELEINQERNISRTGKNFDPDVLATTISKLNPLYRSNDPSFSHWTQIDNSHESPEQTARRILDEIAVK